MAEKGNSRKRKKKKRKCRKLLVSTAAFFTAAVVTIFCVYYVYYETDYFNIAQINVYGNNIYNKDYIIEKSEIELGSKIFSIDRPEVSQNIENEVYVETARVVYELPNTIRIEVEKREEKYQVLYNNEYIVTDKDGITLKTTKEKNDLLTIESLTPVIYNIGENMEFEGTDNVKSIFDTIEYLNSEFGSDTIKGITVDKYNSALVDTEYGTIIKISLDEDVKYQIIFAMKIINERLNNNLTVSAGFLDFTKGDSPVYIEDFEMEDYNE